MVFQIDALGSSWDVFEGVGAVALRMQDRGLQEHGSRASRGQVWSWFEVGLLLFESRLRVDARQVQFGF